MQVSMIFCDTSYNIKTRATYENEELENDKIKSN